MMGSYCDQANVDELIRLRCPTRHWFMPCMGPRHAWAKLPRRSYQLKKATARSATIKTPKRAIAVAKVLSPMERPPSVATLNTANPGAIPAVELGKCAANAYRHLISEAVACAYSQAPPARRGPALQNRFRHRLAFPLRFLSSVRMGPSAIPTVTGRSSPDCRLTALCWCVAMISSAGDPMGDRRPRPTCCRRQSARCWQVCDRVDHLDSGIVGYGKCVYDAAPGASPAPADKTIIAGRVRAKMARQIAPRCAGSQDPEDAVEDTSVVYPRNATRLAWQHGLDGNPFIISEFVAHDSSLQFGSLNHRGWGNRNASNLAPRRLRAEVDINMPTVPAQTVENDPLRTSGPFWSLDE
jgi:hypothetical protein